MKVTRLRKGYTIRLTDGEFEALGHLVLLGSSDMEGADPADYSMSRGAVRALNGRLGEQNPLRVDDDRR
jgi:hypothetical protein